MNKNTKKYFYIDKPSFFSFKEHLLCLERKSNCPINHINSRSLTRCLDYLGNLYLVELRETKKKIRIELIKGNINPSLLKTEVRNILGFDDCLLHGGFPELNSKTSMDVSELYSISFPKPPSLFEHLTSAIVGQQISGSVANSIRHKLIMKYGRKLIYKNETFFIFPYPDNIYNLNPESLKKLGVSLKKANAIISIAKSFLNPNWVSQLKDKSTRSDQIRDMLCSIKGVGPWTANWFLLCALRRFECVPCTDLVVRKAVSWWWGKDYLLSSTEVYELTQSVGSLRGLVVYKITIHYMSIMNLV